MKCILDPPSRARRLLGRARTIEMAISGGGVMIRLQKINHLSLPAVDLDRAREFYTNVLGLTFHERLGGHAGGPDGGLTPRLDVFKTPNGDEIVLFERPNAQYDGPRAGVGLLHQAFDLKWEDFDEALATAKELGTVDRVVDRPSGKDIYLTDSEGNYLQLHFAPPSGAT
jgi:catechol 2,3-dioxygenase-like lactoylglutathione lyase family enzyme